jgi:ArsR family transcriptional regulator
MRAAEFGSSNGSDLTGSIAEVSALGQALSDPIRVKMLGMLAEVRECCDLPERGLPVATDQATRTGICVCEFVEHFEMGQSKVSYHLGKLREAGLVEEARRGKWRYYSLREEAVSKALTTVTQYLGAT